MKMQVFRLACFMGIAIFSLHAVGEARPWLDPPPDQPDLDVILKRTGAYCDRLGRSALYFVCREKIEEESQYRIRDSMIRTHGYLPPAVQKHTWVYDYQLIKRENRFEEKRLLLKENGRFRHKDHARLETHFFYSQRSILGPVGLLRTENQAGYDYRIIKIGRAAGRKAIILEVHPRDAAPDNPNYGKIWVDQENFSVIKIQVDADSLAGYSRPRRMGAAEAPTVTHIYGIEKNGLRFPSETTFSQKYDYGYRYRSVKKILTGCCTKFTYSDYRFFTVEVDVKIKGDQTR